MCGAYLEQRRGIALVCPCWVHVRPFFQALHLYFWPCTSVSRAGLVCCEGKPTLGPSCTWRARHGVFCVGCRMLHTVTRNRCFQAP